MVTKLIQVYRMIDCGCCKKCVISLLLYSFSYHCNSDAIITVLKSVQRSILSWMSMVIKLPRNKDKYKSVHIMIFCKLFAEEHQTSTLVWHLKTTSSPTTSWLLHVLCYSCCYFISIPMHTAAVGQHKAIKSLSANTRRLPLRIMMIRSLPPWPQHRTAPIKRSYSNLPMDLRTADIADLKSVKCRHCRHQVGKLPTIHRLCVGNCRLGVGNFARGLQILFWRERDLPGLATCWIGRDEKRSM